MKELLNNPGFIALVGTLFGGVGLKVVESWLGRAKEKAAVEASLRDELRKQIEDLEEKEEKLVAQIDIWKMKYYDLRDERSKLAAELTIAYRKIEELESQVSKLIK